MTELAAIKAAIGLLHLPSSVRHVRSEPLPPGIDHILSIASGDGHIARDVAELTERPLVVIQNAAIFFIEQILLSPDSDCYRVLGGTPSTPAPDLRRNMALLMSWLHPDKNLSGERAVFASRVTEAWDTLRNPERKAAYDAALLASVDAQQSRSSHLSEWRTTRGGVKPLLHENRPHGDSSIRRPAKTATIFGRVWGFLQSRSRD
jgi:DnaJ-domain-containing protein 1